MNLITALLVPSYIALAIVPGYVFLSDKGGLALFNGLDPSSFCSAVFPLFGLYAFFLIWGQILIGSSMPLLRIHIPWIETFHRVQGTFALVLGISHPILLAFSLGLTEFLTLSFVSAEQRVFVYLGYFQLCLLILTAGTALLMRLPFLVNRWHYIHYLNYVLFVAIFVHSWNLGSDLTTNQFLRIVWCFFAISTGACIVARFLRLRRSGAPISQARITAVPATSVAQSEGGPFVVVASLDDLQPGKPFYAKVSDKAILLCLLDDTVYAIDDTCSHARGSLSQGKLDGAVIQCPLHGAKFDVRTGAVVSPPAKTPQHSYPIQIKDGKVQLRL